MALASLIFGTASGVVIVATNTSPSLNLGSFHSLAIPVASPLLAPNPINISPVTRLTLPISILLYLFVFKLRLEPNRNDSDHIITTVEVNVFSLTSIL